MPMKTHQPELLPETSPTAIPAELLDHVVKGLLTQQSLETVMKRISGRLSSSALHAEMSHHPGYAPGEDKSIDVVSRRNGESGKTVLTDDGPLRIDIPRDRKGLFEPLLIDKHERRFTGFDDKIIFMYARDMTVREI